MITANNDSTKTGSLWRWVAGIAAVVVATIVGWFYFGYPDYVRRAKESHVQMLRGTGVPTEELKALREKHQPKNMSFSAKACTETYTPPLPAAALPEKRPDTSGSAAPATSDVVSSKPISAADLRFGVMGQVWKPDGSLEIAARVVAGCSASIPVGSYSTEGAKLRLEYLVHFTPGPQIACLCVYELQYAITGLEKRPYEFELAVRE